MPSPRPWRPTPQQIAAAADRRVPDVVAPSLRVLFVGINPGLYSGAVGHHFARPGNRFWKALHRAGFTDRLLSPFEERELLERGIGITNLVERATASAAELSAEELRTGARRLERKVRRFRPSAVAVLGIGAFRQAFQEPKAALGRQARDLADAALWVLPNPSGLNAHFQLPELIAAFRELPEALAATRRAEARPDRAGPRRGARPRP